MARTEVKRVQIAYAPRKQFLPFHNRKERWAVTVAHRRCGKTVACVNDLIKRALTEGKEDGQYAYICPFLTQAKSVAWLYLLKFSENVRVKANASELWIELMTGARIRLFGADNAEALRGMYLDGIVLDEYADMKPRVWGEVIRPLLADRQGWAVFIGTPKGKNNFWDIYDSAQQSPNWHVTTLKASETNLLPASELEDAKSMMSDDQYLQEFECSFEAAILGAYYGKEMRIAEQEGRISAVPYDRNAPVHTAWDLGYTDDTSIVFFQVIGGEIHIIDHFAGSGLAMDDYLSVVKSKHYRYGKHWLPHDARAKTLASGGKSIQEMAQKELGLSNVRIVPDLSLQDGIQAVRALFARLWMDAVKCKEYGLLESLRQYQREWDDDKKRYRDRPRHDWTSHCFIGSTEVLTRSGTCQIMNLPKTGEVLTSCGWKQYTNPRVTKKNARLVEVRFANGNLVKCTQEHLFLTNSGWKSAENLTRDSIILSTLTPLRNISMAACIAYGQVKDICQKVAKGFIEMFGLQHLGQFHKVATSITKIQTLQTTILKIWNVCLQKSICLMRGNNIKETTQNTLLMKLGKKQQNGTSQKKAGFGISETLKKLKFGLIGNVKNAHVCIAKCLSWRLYAKMDMVTKSIVQVAVKPLIIDCVIESDEIADVWCMTVPDVENFSLGNGAIVHNCADSVRYMAIAWREEYKAPEVPKPKFWHEQTLQELFDETPTRRHTRI